MFDQPLKCKNLFCRRRVPKVLTSGATLGIVSRLGICVICWKTQTLHPPHDCTPIEERYIEIQYV